MKTGKTRIIASLGLTVGIISGAVAAYFLAPRKGEYTQKILVEKGNKMAQKSIRKLEEGLVQFEVALEKTDQIQNNQF